MVDHTELTDLAGYREVRAALAAWAEHRGFDGSCWCWSEEYETEAVGVIMAVSRPYVQAEVLADAADYLAATGQAELANILDNVSAGIRKAVGSA